MKRVKNDAASFQKLSTVQMTKIKGGETITVIGPDGKPITIII